MVYIFFTIFMGSINIFIVIVFFIHNFRKRNEKEEKTEDVELNLLEKN